MQLKREGYKKVARKVLKEVCKLWHGCDVDHWPQKAAAQALKVETGLSPSLLPTPYTLHLTSYTLHPTPYTQFPNDSTRHLLARVQGVGFPFRLFRHRDSGPSDARVHAHTHTRTLTRAHAHTHTHT